MELIKNEIIVIDDKLSVKTIGNNLYWDVIEQYSDTNFFHIPSTQEGLFISDNYYQIFGPGISYLTTERHGDESIATIDLGLGIIMLEDIRISYPTILIKFS